jgi:dTDP-4-dehydrorhamnose reductase
MKLLIFGGSGQAGVDLRKLAAQAGDSVIAPGHADLDIRDVAATYAMIAEAQADAVINLAAFHVLNACEDQFADAMAVNCTAIWQMAKACAAIDCRFITVSTDYVFDGKGIEPYREGDAANPIQAYGVSKRAGELAALAAGPKTSLIVRTCGLYGHSGSRERSGNFVEKRLAEMARSSRIAVGGDLVCTPTSAQFFARALHALAREGGQVSGIYHLTNEGQCSWAEFTREIVKLAGSNCLVDTVDHAGHYGNVRRPAYSVMANIRAKELGIVLPHWRHALEEYMQTRDRP